MSDDFRELVKNAHKRGHGLTPESALWDDPRWETEWAFDPETILDALRPYLVSGSCDDTHGVWRCQGDIGHAGAHWADVGKSPAVLRWGMVGYGCAEPTCNRKPGHDGPHRDGRGLTWVPLDAEDEV